VVVAFAPGGPADIAGRLVAQAIQEKLGQAVVVENKGGAGGNVAAKYVAKEAPDGYTLLVTTSSMAVNQTIYQDPGYNAVQDFAPIALVADSPNILVTHPSDPAANLAEFLRNNKGKSVSYGSAGIGSTPHLAGWPWAAGTGRTGCGAHSLPGRRAGLAGNSRQPGAGGQRGTAAGGAAGEGRHGQGAGGDQPQTHPHLA
jgi:tripartite-type tricarboxylate transporter receptor subunit TctC